ncbi:DUF1801 domain-containing protein [Aureispira anguillae]|uniref:DUF1801 domain-containing protein n=1 Tax=Aureispira anguillae TaxID=2864201 RepID=A0A915YAY3_9BACT|nr:DUF1801 domain-containing protein [Aureispira anguillae]BDS09600.1 DUF1801 domain-containing protein [Aureispira anguillae]
MIRELDQFYANKEEPNRGCLLALRNFILEQDVAVSETQKYGMPCFCYKKRHFCYLWVDKKTNDPYLLMVEGKYLEHPKLEQGTRKRMKIFRVNPKEDLPITELQTVLQAALSLYRKGIIVVK